MDRSMFNPPRKLREDIAPTEMDSDFRKRLIWGEVHDENAWAMGGIAGHAGLFSTAEDIASFAQMILNGGIYGNDRVLARSTIQQFTARQTIAGSARTLGWDVPEEPSSSGRYFSAKSFGHTGFTGTSLWIDPERDLFVVLLTNRVNPTRANEKISQVRPALHDAIFEGLGLASRPGRRTITPSAQRWPEFRSRAPSRLGCRYNRPGGGAHIETSQNRAAESCVRAASIGNPLSKLFAC